MWFKGPAAPHSLCHSLFFKPIIVWVSNSKCLPASLYSLLRYFNLLQAKNLNRRSDPRTSMRTAGFELIVKLLQSNWTPNWVGKSCTAVWHPMTIIHGRTKLSFLLDMVKKPRLNPKVVLAMPHTISKVWNSLTSYWHWCQRALHKPAASSQCMDSGHAHTRTESSIWVTTKVAENFKRHEFMKAINSIYCFKGRFLLWFTHLLWLGWSLVEFQHCLQPLHSSRF